MNSLVVALGSEPRRAKKWTKKRTNELRTHSGFILALIFLVYLIYEYVTFMYFCRYSFFPSFYNQATNLVDTFYLHTCKFSAPSTRTSALFQFIGCFMSLASHMDVSSKKLNCCFHSLYQIFTLPSWCLFPSMNPQLVLIQISLRQHRAPPNVLIGSEAQGHDVRRANETKEGRVHLNPHLGAEMYCSSLACLPNENDPHNSFAKLIRLVFICGPCLSCAIILKLIISEVWVCSAYREVKWIQPLFS